MVLLENGFLFWNLLYDVLMSVHEIEKLISNFSWEYKSIKYVHVSGHLNSKQLPLEASFSPDSQFVISGSSDGRIHIWNSENGQKICVLNGDHKGPVQCVQVNIQVVKNNFQTSTGCPCFFLEINYHLIMHNLKISYIWTYGWLKFLNSVNWLI